MSLSKLEEGIKKEADNMVSAMLNDLNAAIKQYIFARTRVAKIAVTNEDELNELTKQIINALAGDTVSRDRIVDKVVDAAAVQIIRKAL